MWIVGNHSICQVHSSHNWIVLNNSLLSWNVSIWFSFSIPTPNNILGILGNKWRNHINNIIVHPAQYCNVFWIFGYTTETSILLLLLLFRTVSNTWIFEFIKLVFVGTETKWLPKNSLWFKPSRPAYSRKTVSPLKFDFVVVKFIED